MGIGCLWGCLDWRKLFLLKLAVMLLGVDCTDWV